MASHLFCLGVALFISSFEQYDFGRILWSGCQHAIVYFLINNIQKSEDIHLNPGLSSFEKKIEILGNAGYLFLGDTNLAISFPVYHSPTHFLLFDTRHTFFFLLSSSLLLTYAL